MMSCGSAERHERHLRCRCSSGVRSGLGVAERLQVAHSRLLQRFGMHALHACSWCGVFAPQGLLQGHGANHMRGGAVLDCIA
jgi:hypothetical protein